MTVTVTTAPLLEVSELCVRFPGADAPVRAADSVSFALAPGRTLGLVGESGCGKSVTLRALMGIVPEPGEVVGGRISFEGRDVGGLRGRELERLRGSRMSMIFQDPGASLDPVLTVGTQLVETLRVKAGLSRRAAARRAVDLLDRVGIPSPERRVNDYPHQLSGGMRQRVMIALAVATDPVLLLADEPTTALDVTIQDQILALLADLQEETGMAMILVSHDLAVIGQCCHDVAVMYAGKVVEMGSVDAVLDHPRHPYTAGLLAAMPDLGAHEHEPLVTIGGQPPDLAALPPGCSFAPRCRFAQERCRQAPMELDRADHGSACIRAGEIEL
jgi:oligopeptide/dipeptide ABC transporter ATP-binding protein